MKGTFNGSTFTPDASSATKMILEPGSYNFVCYNDKFQEVGNNLELNINDAKEAYICQTTQEIYGYTAQQHITFNMRHACSRIEVFLECYGKLSSGTTASVTPVGTSAKTKLVYVGATNSFTQTAGSISPSTLTFSGAELTGTNVFGAVTADKKIYLLPGTDFTKLQMKFTGGTFGKNRNMSDAPAMLPRIKSTQSEGHATLPRRKSTQSEGHAMLSRRKSTQSEGHATLSRRKLTQSEGHAMLSRRKSTQSEGHATLRQRATSQIQRRERFAKGRRAKSNGENASPKGDELNPTAGAQPVSRRSLIRPRVPRNRWRLPQTRTRRRPRRR